MLFIISKVCIGQELENHNPEVAAIFKNMYNFQFHTSLNQIEEIKKKHPKSNIPWLTEAYFYMGNIISGDTVATNVAKCSHALNKSLEYSNKVNPVSDELFNLICIYGIKARIELIQGNYFQVLNYLYKSLDILKSTFGAEKETPKFYLTSGLYNFYVEHARNSMAYLSPFMSLFPDGNIETGIAYLKRAQFLDGYCGTEANYYLMKIYSEYTPNYTKALVYAHQLAAQYPNNLFFQYSLIELYIILGYEKEVQSQLYVLTAMVENNNQLNERQKAYYTQKAFEKTGTYFKNKYDNQNALIYFEKALELNSLKEENYYKAMLQKALIIQTYQKNKAENLLKTVLTEAASEDLKDMAKTELKNFHGKK